MKAISIAALDIRRLLRERANLFFLFVLPMLIILLLGAAFGSSAARVGVHVGRGALARELVATLDSEQNLNLRHYKRSSEVERGVQQGEVEAGLLIPGNYDTTLQGGGSVTLDDLGRPDTLAAQLAPTIQAAVARQSALIRAARLPLVAALSARGATVHLASLSFTYLGATADLDPAGGPYLVIDVGGGSTELVGGLRTALQVVSLEIGCVRATERFFEHDPPLRSELEAARVHVRRLVTAAVEARPELDGAAHLIGVAGTVAALVRLDQGLLCYDRSRIHHARLTLAAIERLIDELGAVRSARRLEWPALEAERADVIIGGAAVLAEAMVVLGFDVLTASESDLLDGIVAELLAG